MSTLLKFSVESKSESATRTEIQTRGFKLIVDEPEPKALPHLDYKIVVGNSLVSKFAALLSLASEPLHWYIFCFSP